MYLTKYRKLSRGIKAIATRYWLAVILERLNLDNLNQLAFFINEKSNAPCHAKCSVSFLYKKWNGSPIESENKIKLMDEIVPGSSQCLTNPLWQLLDHSQPDLAFTNSIICSLNGHITHSLFKPATDMAYPERFENLSTVQIDRIARLNTPDALTCLLSLSLECKPHRMKLERCSYRLFTRLTAFTPLKAIRYELHKLIYFRIFPKNEQQINDMKSFDFHIRFDADSRKFITIGSFFIPADKRYLDELAQYYQINANDMASLNLIHNAHRDKMMFCHLFDNTDQGWIKSAVIGLKKGRNKFCTDHLPQLLKAMKYINRTQ